MVRVSDVNHSTKSTGTIPTIDPIVPIDQTRSPMNPHPPPPNHPHIALPALYEDERGCLRSRCLSCVTDNGLQYNLKTCIPVCLTNDAGH